MARIRVEDVDKQYGGAPLFEGLEFEVHDGEFMVIIGPSGCGKSTLLRIIAGIETMNSGRVLIGDTDVSARHPGDRDVSMVFQDYALYPHMTVEQNLSFGLRARREGRDTIRDKVTATAAALDIQDYLQRRPAQLSGGQRQRVALGRAMIRDPHAYLMDEPLSNLDAHLRVQMRAELIEFHRRTGGTILYVTHDQAEAMTMGERIAVMNAGRVEQIGSPTDVYQRPANTFVAGFLGSPRMNFITGTLTRETSELTVTAGDIVWRIPGEAPASLPESVLVGFRPEAVAITSAGTGPTAGAATFTRELNYVEHLGHELIVHLRPVEGVDAGLVTRLHLETAIAPSGPQQCAVRTESISVFDSAGHALFHGHPTTAEGIRAPTAVAN